MARYKSNAVPGGDFSDAWIRLFFEMGENFEAQLDANATQQEKAAFAAEERMSGKDGISAWKTFLAKIKEAQPAEDAQAKKEEEEAAKEAEAGM